MPAGSVGEVYWVNALRGLKLLGEEWPEPLTYERLESVELRIWGEDQSYDMSCKHRTSKTWAKTFDCWLASPDAAQRPHGEDIGVAFADSSAFCDRLIHFYPYTLDITAEAVTVLDAFERWTVADSAAVVPADTEDAAVAVGESADPLQVLVTPGRFPLDVL